MTLFTKNKENWTRFKVGVKQIHTIPPKILLALGEPTKKTTRFWLIHNSKKFRKEGYVHERYNVLY